MLSRNILYKAREYHWLLLPATSIPQDVFLKRWSKNKTKATVNSYTASIALRNIFQHDGSRMAFIYAQNLDDDHMKHKIMARAPDMGEPYTSLGTPTSLDFFTSDPARFTYIAYHVHTFLNGKRYIPIMLDNNLHGYWRVQELFPDLIPEDEFGLLISDRDQLDIHPDHFVIRGENTIPFLSYIRLCPTCGRVSDHSHPIQEPWLHYRTTRYKPEEQKVTPDSLGKHW